MHHLFRWGHGRLVAAVALALGAVVALGAVAAVGGGGADKPGPAGTPEGAPMASAPPVPGEPERPQPSPFTVPARAPAPVPDRCPVAWAFFENPVGRYDVCVPPGWAFGDLRTVQPLDRLASATLASVHLLSPEAFPWPAGSRVFDVVRARDAVTVAIDIVGADHGVDDEANAGPCVPSVGASCAETYDAGGRALSEAGPLHVLKVLLPLNQPPLRVHRDAPAYRSAHLLVTVRSTTPRFGKEASLVWRIIRSVRAW